MKRFLFLPIVFALLTAGCAFHGTQLPALIPRDLLFGQPERTNPQISPDGKSLAYIAPDGNNLLQIWVRTLGAQDDRQLTAEKTHGIWHYTWTFSPNKLVFAQDVQGDENWQIHTIDTDTGATKNLTPYKGVQSRRRSNTSSMQTKATPSIARKTATISPPRPRSFSRGIWAAVSRAKVMPAAMRVSRSDARLLISAAIADM